MMSLETLKNNWESLAERDALYAILTDHRRAGGKWKVPEFMATGEAEIETVMDHVAGIGCTPDYAGKALDFGCGVGRVTQALAPRFTSCVGVDISPQMIDKARSLNRYAHCRYLANPGEQLPFADASFSFIYSNIVLQHVPRRFSTAYLKEFVRVLAPGGILVRVRHILRIRSRIRAAAGVGDMQMHCLPEHVVRKALGPARIVDIQFTNTAAKDFNGELVYLRQGPRSGYVGKQYCVRL
jgi:SAM-dependent methyltransferase